MKKLILIIFVLVCLPMVLAQTEHLISLQGFATDSSDEAVASGDLKVEIYTASSGGSPYWSQTYTGAIENGVFDVVLGSSSTLMLDNTNDYWMELYVNNDEVVGDGAGGRQRFYPGGGDHTHTHPAEDITGGTLNVDRLIVDTNVLHVNPSSNRVGINTQYPTAELEVAGEFRVGSSSGYPKLEVETDPADHSIKIGHTWDDGVTHFGTPIFLYPDQFILLKDYIGLGTSSPLRHVHIKRDSNTRVLIESDAEDTAGLLFKTSTNDYDYYMKGGVIFERTGSLARGSLHLAVDSAADSGNVQVSDAKLTVDHTGDVIVKNNLGVGTDTPSGNLDVVENGDVQVNIHSNTDGPTPGSKLLVVKTGEITPMEQFSVDDDGNIVTKGGLNAFDTIETNSDLVADSNTRGDCAWTGWGGGQMVCPDGKYVAGVEVDHSGNEERVYCCEI